MRLSTQTLRAEFKEGLEKWNPSHLPTENKEEFLPKIKKLCEQLEKRIEEKVQLLEADFQDHILAGEYLRSVTEGFDDLERLMRNRKTFLDIAEGDTIEEVLDNIKKQYKDYLNPLLNIMSKLENDYMAVANQTIVRKQDEFNQIQVTLHKLKLEQKRTRYSFWSFSKNKKLEENDRQIKMLDLKRKIIQLTLHHDRLNLYYFNHDHPIELREIKKKTDSLKLELKKLVEAYYEK